MTVKLTVDEIRAAVRLYVEQRLQVHAVKDVRLGAFEGIDGKMVVYADAVLDVEQEPNGPYR